jgi:hypothetical protein
MARPKYKLGTRIEFTNHGPAEMDTVKGVVAREDGYHYEVDSHDAAIPENNVIAAYRKIEARKSAKKAAKAAPRTRKPVAQEHQATA